MRALRRILVVAVAAVAITVPVAVATIADPFGAPEVSDPILRPWDGTAPVLGADAAGNAYWLSFVRTSGKTQAAVYERCTGGPWRPTLFGPPTNDDLYPLGLKVAANGTAMVIWLVVGSQSSTYYSAVRPPGGAWGAPQVVRS